MGYPGFDPPDPLRNLSFKAGSPADPMTGMAEAMTSLHEVFTTAVRSGFTEGQALTLIASLLAHLIRGESQEGGA